MIFFDGPTKQYASVGTLIELEQYKSMPDGRILVLCAGRSRFRVLDILRPESDEQYCKVRAELIDDEHDDLATTTAEAAAATEEEAEVWRLLQQVLDQSNRLQGTSLQLKPSAQQLAPVAGAAGGGAAEQVPAAWEWYARTAVAGGGGAAAAVRRRLFSLEVAQVLASSAEDLQRMLQARSTLRRLRIQRRLLDDATRMLAARIALKDAAAAAE